MIFFEMLKVAAESVEVSRARGKFQWMYNWQTGQMRILIHTYPVAGS